VWKNTEHFKYEQYRGPVKNKGDSGALETNVVPTLHEAHVVLLNVMVEVQLMT